MSGIRSCNIPGEARTQRLVVLQALVMPSPELRPFRKLVLGAGVVHVALELDNFAFHALLLTCLLGCLCRQFEVQEP